MTFTNAFIGRAEKPTSSDLTEVLSGAHPLWNTAITLVEEVTGPLRQEWKSYGRKSGWVLKLMQGKQTVSYLSPSSGYFGVSVVLGASSVSALSEQGASADLVEMVTSARHYVEGTPVMIEVRDAADIQTVLCLVRAKLHRIANKTAARSSAATR